MGSPYRSDPQWKICPRCDEVLDEVMAGGYACPRCAGAWLASVVVAEAFHDANWPQGHAMWWRAELACPECRKPDEVMEAIEVEGIVVDRCKAHGMWFDAGELGRLMKGEGLADLRAKVSLTREQIAALRVRRRAAETENLAAELRKRVVELERARDEVGRLEREVDRLREQLSVR